MIFLFKHIILLAYFFFKFCNSYLKNNGKYSDIISDIDYHEMFNLIPKKLL